PEVAEDAVAERRLVEVVDPRGAAGAGAPADDALDHPGVALAPDDHDLLELDEGVDELAGPGQAGELAVALEEDDAGADAAAEGAGPSVGRGGAPGPGELAGQCYLLLRTGTGARGITRRNCPPPSPS